MPTRSLTLILTLAVSFAASGCRDAKIASYRVPKEAPPSAAAVASAPDPHAGLGIPPAGSSAPAAPANMPNMASTPVPTATGGDLTWTAPAHWQTKAASAMRKATFIVPGDSGAQAELAVTAFPGNVGGNLANVNRWRQQLQLPPITEAELGSALEHLDVGALHVDVAELLGPAPADGSPRQRVLGAIVPFNGATWFFKLTGPDALVTREKPAFVEFLKTVRPAL